MAGENTMQAQAKAARLAAVTARPLSELLDCPAATSSLLTGSAESMACDAGERIFRQNDSTRGLYLVVSGDFVRKAERLNARLTLGSVRPGELVELAAALGDQHHTYTLTAITPGSLLLLPIAALQQAFEAHPPLRMRLLEELAREVSRAYLSCAINRVMPARRNHNGAAMA
jgi:CRP-like cAMP-binding protein